jgi:hypothetical protein
MFMHIRNTEGFGILLNLDKISEVRELSGTTVSVTTDKGIEYAVNASYSDIVKELRAYDEVILIAT